MVSASLRHASSSTGPAGVGEQIEHPGEGAFEAGADTSSDARDAAGAAGAAKATLSCGEMSDSLAEGTADTAPTGLGR